MPAAAILACGAITLSLSSCTGDGTSTTNTTSTPTGTATASPNPSQDAVAAVVEPRLAETGIVADPGSLDCGDQASLADATSVKCDFTAGGQPVNLTADVTQGEGDQVSLAVETTPEPIKADVLAADLTARAGAQLGVSLDPGSCTGDLPATVGASVTCTVRLGSASRETTVKVNDISGGQITWGVTFL